jgi:hypothetical protein
LVLRVNEITTLTRTDVVTLYNEPHGLFKTGQSGVSVKIIDNDNAQLRVIDSNLPPINRIKKTIEDGSEELLDSSKSSWETTFGSTVVNVFPTNIKKGSLWVSGKGLHNNKIHGVRWIDTEKK